MQFDFSLFVLFTCVAGLLLLRRHWSRNESDVTSL